MVAERIERRLAAILVADVAGYSSLMSNDEEFTLMALIDHRQVLIEPCISENRGRIVKTSGDGILAEFSSAVDAVSCAIAIQRGMLERNKCDPPNRRISFRIGVNLGDIIVQDDDIYGEGVNVAARLEAMSDPGGIFISASIREQVVGRIKAQLQDCGHQSLKNIARPVHVFAIRDFVDLVERSDSRLPITDKPAVAVLPFENMSRDPDQDYFSNGLTEDIITALSHWHSFPVIARNSSFSYQGKPMKVQDIGTDLGAKYVLEGSVRKSGGRLRVTAQLVDAETGHHIWAERFDRQLEDVFGVQDEITKRIAATIIPELEHFEQARSVGKPTESLTAWDCLLRGLETFHDSTCEGNAAAMSMFLRAVELDPSYCDAWARLSWSYSRQVMLNCVEQRETALTNAFDAARKAISLDHGSAVAHLSLGSAYIWAGETELGLAEAQVALQLNPNFAHAAMAVGNRLDLVGRTEEGIAQMERSLVLNPRDPNRWRYMAYLSRAYTSIREYEKAADWARQAVYLRPDHPEALFRCAVCVSHLDSVNEAGSLLERCEATEPGFIEGKIQWQPYSSKERNDHFFSGLRRHRLLDRWLDSR